MILWRISNYADLQGIGGLIAGGRWHNKGIPVVYLAEHPALALLEVLVQFELATDEVPANFQLLEVDSEDAPSLSLDTTILTPGWQQDLNLSRAIGDQWLTSQASALLQVPSVLVPQSHNYLLNPRHPDAAFLRIINVTSQPFDPRLRGQ